MSTEYKTMTPAEVLSHLADPELTLVDVRTPAEHDLYHIPNSLLIPLQDLPARFHEELNTDHSIIVYCEHGVRSKAAATFLAANGFDTVAHMAGGMASWNGPVEPE